jgi:hypothetical protein
MGTRRPTVDHGWVDISGPPSRTLRLESAAWWTWLADPTTTSFRYGLFDPQRGYLVGFVTVRKETRQRGGVYWVAFRRMDGRVQKRYLGSHTALTAARLAAVAASLWDRESVD